jgi:DNA-binding CsgD family transcriptional regulator
VRVVVRRAALSLDSDPEPDTELLIRGARGAVFLVDLPLADRLADAANRAGAGAEASFIRAYVLSNLGHGHEADEVLAGIPGGDLTDVDRARLAFMRAMNRLFTLADPAGAKQLIDDASQATPSQARSCIDAFLTVYWAAMGKPNAARESSRNVGWDQLPASVARVTTWAITVAAAEAGRTTDAVAAALAGYPNAIRGFLAITDAHTSALLLSGRIADAQDVAEMLRQRAANFPSPQLNPKSEGVAGRVSVGAGRLDTACSLLTVAVEALTASGDPNGWGYRYQIPRTIALAMRGLIDEAAASLAALETMQHPSWQCLEYELALARAWVAANQGAVSESIRRVLAAAETAHGNGQFAAEVMCLQTATQLGDGSTAARLRELEAIVEGPRAGVAARFAEAMRASDDAELSAVSDEFEAMGDLVAAVDAAAHAAIAYRRRNLRGSALRCSTRAEGLADQCGGANTPALRRAAVPFPLTDREREIVMLVSEGLSNRDIAARLTLSVRSVENHIYRAMAKTGAANRDDLAALLPRRKPASQE